MSAQKLKQIQEEKKEMKKEELNNAFFKEVLFGSENVEKVVEKIIDKFVQKDIFVEFRIPKLNWRKIIHEGTLEFSNHNLGFDLSKDNEKHEFTKSWFSKTENLKMWPRLSLKQKKSVFRLLLNLKNVKLTVVSKDSNKDSKEKKQEKKEKKSEKK